MADRTEDPTLLKKDHPSVMTEGPTEDPTLLKKLEGVKVSDEPAMEAAGPSKVKEPTEVKLQDKSPIEFKFPRELNNVLVDTRRLHLFDRYDWYRYHNRHGNIDRNLKLEQHTTEISVIEYGNEVPVSMSWTIDGDGTWIVLKRGLPLNLLISALVPLCHEVEHITIGYCEDMYIHAHGTIKPFIPMRSVLTVCLYLRYSLASLQVILQTISNCFPNATNLELKSMYQEFSRTHGYHFDTTQSSLKNLKLDLCNLTDCGTLDNLFLSISSSCQNIESLTVTSSETLKWDKSSRDITACKLPYLTNIHLESRWLEEHYALQFLADLLHVGRLMSPSLNLVKVESVQLKDIVMKSVEWSRTSTDCGLQIKGAAAAVPITELIDLTTSDLQEITVLTFDSCKIDNFGHCLHQSPQSPKESGTLREIRIFGSESPLSESDREKLSEVYPNVKVTEKPGSQESSGESHEGARIPSNLDESLFQPSQTSLIGKLEGATGQTPLQQTEATPESPFTEMVDDLVDPTLLKKPSELNDALSDTRRLHVFDHYGWYEYKTRHRNIAGYLTLTNSGLLSDWTQAEVSVITRGQEYHWPISWNIDDDGAWIVFKDLSPLHLIKMISALASLCQKVEHIVIGSRDDRFFLLDRSPVIPMRSVLSVYLYSMIVRLHVSLQTVSMCFPNAKSLVQECEMAISFRLNFRHHFGISLSSLRRLELRIARNLDTLDNLFLLLSSCQNIESLTVTSDITLKYEKSSTAIRECKLPNLTDIHLQSSWSGEHYTFQLLADLLHVGRVMSPSLRFVKVESVQLRDVVMTSVEWSRTSSDCGLQIQGVSLLPEELAFEWPLRYALRKSAAVPMTESNVPITELIDITTSEFKEVTVLTLVGCKIDFGQSDSKSLQSPKKLGTLREIRFVGSENPLSKSDRNKLSELYPNVKVTTTEKQENQESSEESQEGAGIPSKLDKASSQSLKTSAMDERAEEKVEFNKDTGSQNPEGGEEETSWQEKEEEFDVNQGSMSHESVPDEGDVETTKEECCKRVGADGGRLELESFGIELEIPPGAIDSKEPQEISLRVLTDTPNLGDTKEEMSVCFGVQCLAPDDLVLRSPVTYTIPHCAVATRYSSLQAVLYSGEGEYSPHAVIKERKVLSSSEIPSCKIMKDVLKLKMDHFSWAKIKIRINNIFFQGKRICFVPFKEKNLSLAKTPLILHANFYDDVKGQKETVESDEKELQYVPAYREQNVKIKKAEVDLKVKYCVDDNEEKTAIISFCRLINGPNICEPIKVDVPNQPDSVLISMNAGQSKKQEANCSFWLDFPIQYRKENVPLQVGVEHGATSLQAQQTSEGTLRMNPARKMDFDDILETIAKKVASRQEIHNLGKALGFGPEDIDRYVEENQKETGVSYMGTLSMLRRWRKKKKTNTELKALQTALEEAGQIHLADVLFGE